MDRFDKLAVRQEFADWFNDALTHAGVVEDRGRAPAVARRYGVSAPAARKWLQGEGLPDMAQFLLIVDDLRRYTYATNPMVEAAKAARLEDKIGDEPYAIQRFSRGEANPGYVRLPLLAMEGGMGEGVHSDEAPSVVEYLDVAEWWADLNLPKHIDRIKLITGRGDSNAPLINHGDIIFVDTVIDHFQGEGLYVFNWQGMALVKRLVPDLRSDGLRIVSANPAYPPEHISLGEVDQLHIAGRVVAWYSLRKS